MTTVARLGVLFGGLVIVAGLILLLPGEWTGGADIPLGLFLTASGYLAITLALTSLRRGSK